MILFIYLLNASNIECIQRWDEKISQFYPTKHALAIKIKVNDTHAHDVK